MPTLLKSYPSKDMQQAYLFYQTLPDATKKTFSSVLGLMSSMYCGNNERYIDLNSKRVEYRYSAIKKDGHLRKSHVYGYQRHVIVRLYLNAPYSDITYQSKVLRNYRGELHDVLDIKVNHGEGLENLRRILSVYATFAKLPTLYDVADSDSNELASASFFSNEQDERSFALTLRAVREEQQKFKRLLIENLEGRCVISGCSVKNALDGAHITRYNGKKSNVLGNGLLLRADLHRLWDRLQIAINPHTNCVWVAKSARKPPYDCFHGKALESSLIASRFNALNEHWKQCQDEQKIKSEHHRDRKEKYAQST